MRARGTAPTICPTTWPPLSTSSVGRLRMSKRADSSGLPSASHLPTRSRSAYLAAMASTCGAMVRQGAHQTAVKSISTGRGEARVSATFLSLISMRLLILEEVPTGRLVTRKAPDAAQRAAFLDWVGQLVHRHRASLAAVARREG